MLCFAAPPSFLVAACLHSSSFRLPQEALHTSWLFRSPMGSMLRCEGISFCQGRKNPLLSLFTPTGVPGWCLSDYLAYYGLCGSEGTE